MMPVINDLMLAVKGSALAWMVVKATAVLAIALVGTSLTRKSRAAVRHVFLTAAFSVLLAMPIASIVTPTIPIAVPITVKEGVAFSSLENASGVSSASRVSADVSTATASARLPRLSFGKLPSCSTVPCCSVCSKTAFSSSCTT
jgi:hypothetical protein